MSGQWVFVTEYQRRHLQFSSYHGLYESHPHPSFGWPALTMEPLLIFLPICPNPPILDFSSAMASCVIHSHCTLPGSAISILWLSAKRLRLFGSTSLAGAETTTQQLLVTRTTEILRHWQRKASSLPTVERYFDTCRHEHPKVPLDQYQFGALISPPNQMWDSVERQDLDVAPALVMTQQKALG